MKIWIKIYYNELSSIYKPETVSVCSEQFLSRSRAYLMALCVGVGAGVVK